MSFGLRFLLFLVALASCFTIPVIAEEESNTAEVQQQEKHECEGRLVLVTGASGNVGTLATKLLLKQGFCVRAFTRNEESTREKLNLSSSDGAASRVEIAVGELGDGGVSVQAAFRPRASSGDVTVSRVLFAAGGEQADYDAVNNRGVAECAAEAAKAGITSMVVISSAWVSKPYSIASLLFNSLYPTLPMALHLQGEDALRAQASFNYVIIRAGRLVGDEEYPKDGPKGLTIAQGDSFSFFGLAGAPGMCHTQLAEAVVTALQVKGEYTVQITTGETGTGDVNAYQGFLQDGAIVSTRTHEDITRVHAQAISELNRALLALGLGGLLLVIGIGWKRGIPMVLAIYSVCLYLWSIWYSDLSVEECLKQMN